MTRPVQECAALLAAGQFEQARILAEQALSLDARDADAWHFLGAALAQQGQREDAADAMARAIALKPGNAQFHANLGIVLKDLNRLGEALQSYDRALSLKPGLVHVLNNRGIALLELKRLKEALESFERALALQPDYVQALYNRGIVLKELRRPEDALKSYDRALVLAPSHAEALNNRGIVLVKLKRLSEALASYDRALEIKPDYAEALNNRGIALVELNRPGEALASYDRALFIRPDYAEALDNRGVALMELKHPDEALKSCDRALEFKPDHFGALNNRGIALLELQRADQALQSFDRALKVKPDYAVALNNRGNVLIELMRRDEALQSFDRALAIDPDYAEAHDNRGLLKLAGGDFRGGWADYEWGWLTRQRLMEARAGVGPEQLSLWVERARLAGAAVLVVAEQGVGDEIMFASMLADLQRDAKSVAIECDARLQGLFGRSFPEVRNFPRFKVPAWRAADYDLLLPTGSLGRLYRNAREQFPGTPYLRPSGELTAQWRTRLAALGPELKIGISWRGGTARTRRQYRSIPLAQFRPILEIEGCRFVSLQYGDVQAEIEETNRSLRRPVIQFEPEEIGDFDRLASLTAALDLVVSVQTAIVHLSGSIGQNCWVMVPSNPEWRYSASGNSIPWYRSVEVLRQREGGAWKEPIGEVAARLAAMAQGRSRAP